MHLCLRLTDRTSKHHTVPEECLAIHWEQTGREPVPDRCAPIQIASPARYCLDLISFMIDFLLGARLSVRER